MTLERRESITKLVRDLFRAKEKRRLELAKLPFEKKILILIQLQKVAEGIPSREKTKACVWNVRE